MSSDPYDPRQPDRRRAPGAGYVDRALAGAVAGTAVTAARMRGPVR